MNILAIDTSLNAVSVCVFDGGRGLSLSSQTVPMERGHAEALLPIVDSVMQSVEHGFSAIDRIAVTVGPGSFTGIRVGIAAAKAMGIALDAPVVGVSTLAAFASEVVLRGGKEDIVAAIDARHGQVYAQMVAPNGRMIIKPHVSPSGDFLRQIGKGPVRFTGPAAANLIIEAWSMHISADAAGSVAIPPIDCVAKLGLSASPETAPPNPLYLKAADVTLPAAKSVHRA
jgi:tRNA threonylcarbamoyl adenosine modification protein YeaZ